jgi:hypothetical protein
MRKIFILLFLLQVIGCTDNVFTLAPISQEQTFNPLFNSKVDILMIVDNSGSMEQHQSELASSAQNLVHRLVDLGFDFQIGVTSTDNSTSGHKGRFVGEPSIITLATGQPAAKLHERILLGSDGSSVEEGLEAARLAVTNTANYGFLRDDALLLVVVLSNEEDASPKAVEEYEKFFSALKPPLPGREHGWMLNFIGVTGKRDEDCKTFGNYKSIGTRYIELANFSGGNTSTICTADLSAAVNGVEKALLTVLTEIVLNRDPNPETLHVYFNNILVPNDLTNGWTYNAAKNSILFHGTYVPKVKTKIDITFEPQGAKQ